MTSKSNTNPELHMILKCGWCGKGNIPKSLTEQDTSFLKNCHLCGKMTYQHRNCAKSYVKQNINKKNPEYNSTVSMEVFNSCTLPLYCHDCNQKECFVCSKKHTDRK